MPISPGSRLGPYEIIAPIGSGGMGEVFHARDTRLDRSVAVKILPAYLASSPQSRARLEREAKAISGLNHPHICTLHDIGHHDGIDYLVMELIQGDVLTDRIGRGPLPLAEVFRIGIEISEALESAHRSGVVHRDLKPGNIMIARSGAKLLDFGLAKDAPSEEAIGTAAVTDTVQKPLTAEGTFVGTYQYMAPEQLDGAAADRRTDIFALGAVLYEMVTGRRAFEGKTRSTVMAAIAAAEPRPISQLRPLAPPALARLIAACLAKDPDDRVQSAHDIALQLRWIRDSADGEVPAPSSRRRLRIAWGLAALLAVALGTGAVLWSKNRPVPPERVQFNIASPPGTSLGRSIALSPDGRRILFRAVDVNGVATLYIRSLDSLEAKPLAGTKGVSFAFWSPDGRNAGFIANGKLHRVDPSEGTVQTIATGLNESSAGASWSENDVIVFNRRPAGPLAVVAASGGDSVEVTKVTPDEPSHLWPWFLPGGTHFLYTARNPQGVTIFAAPVNGGERRKVMDFPSFHSVSQVSYGAGYLFYVRQHILFAQRFDPRRLEVRGDPIKIDDDIEVAQQGRTGLAVASNGTIAYRKSGAPTLTHLTWVDRGGREISRIGAPGPYAGWALSPDEKQVVVTEEATARTLVLLDPVRGTAQRLTFSEFANSPRWMPDGRGIAFSMALESTPNLFIRRLDQTTEERLWNAKRPNHLNSVTKDGRYLIYHEYDLVTQLDLYAMPATAPHAPIPLLKSSFGEQDGDVSPDGKWLAWLSDESGSLQVYVAPFMATGPKIQVSTAAAAAEPRWSLDGRELFYVDTAQRRIMSVSIARQGADIAAGPPEPLFAVDSPNYELGRNGRFLIGKTSLNPNSPGVTVVLNWANPR